MFKPILHVIKVYEGTYSDEALAKIAEWKAGRHENPWLEDSFNHPEGEINVHVRDAADDIALALLSYEPVLWHLFPKAHPKISSIFIDSYHPSDVDGESGRTKVLRRNYREKEKDKLIAEIEQDTGLKVASFQESYKGKKFAI